MRPSLRKGWEAVVRCFFVAWPNRGGFLLRPAAGSAARGRVDEAVLLRKAASWRYEREGRLIGRQGAQDSPLELEEDIFGIRCKSTVKFTIVQALANRGRPVRFFEMREVSGTFHLRKYALDTDELGASLPRRSRSIFEAFETETAPQMGGYMEGALAVAERVAIDVGRLLGLRLSQLEVSKVFEN